MKTKLTVLLASASLAAIASPGFAQTETEPETKVHELDVIVVTARRKEETLQDVPLTVNAVTSDDILELNIREFEDITSVVPGLSLSGSTATVRGIAFNQLVSGTNSTISFYQNDAPVPATDLFNTMFDVGQIELLRGPQGTLRGKASPSGAMTLTTRRPDMEEMGGYVNATATDLNGYNMHAGVGAPIIKDVLAVRLAALWDENEGSGVTSLRNSSDPSSETTAWRGTVLFEPTKDLSFTFTAQSYETESDTFPQAESLKVLDPTAGDGPFFITAGDRNSVQDTPTRAKDTNDNYNLQASWDIGPVRMHYVGQITEGDSRTQEVDDSGDVFGPDSPEALQGFGQFTHTQVETKAHEFRVSSTEPLFDRINYIVGYYQQEVDSPTFFTSLTPILFNPAAPFVVETGIDRVNETKESSFFGNLIYYIDERTELSGGLRHIEYTADAGVLIGGNPIPNTAQNDDFDTTIYTASVKRRFSDSLMAYATIGTSWRPGITAIGNNSVVQSDRERSFLILPPEESTSYEIGLKSNIYDNRMTFNVALFHQEFDNFPYRAGSPIFHVSTDPTGAETVGAFNFVAAVPADVDGAEIEWLYSPNDNLNLSVSASYATSEISNGTIPCNDYSPADGVPDTVATPPTVEAIRDATNGDNIGSCTLTQPASNTPEFSASAQFEQRFPGIIGHDGFVRGLVSYYGDTENDFNNPIDDVDAYALVNLYAGLREGTGAWEVSLYAKNLFDTEEVLSRDVGAFQVRARPASVVSSYRSVSVTDPREIGINFRYAFGAR